MLDFWESVYNIILVLIPSFTALVTTKWVTNNWQTRKEIIEIRRNVQNEFNESAGKLVILLLDLNRIIWSHYTHVTSKTKSKDGKLYDLDTDFPEDPNEQPPVKFSDEIKQFNKNFQAESSFWKLEISLKLHYKCTKPLFDRLLRIMFKLSEARIELLKFINSKNDNEFDTYHDSFIKIINEIQNLSEDFTIELLKMKPKT